MQQDLTGHFRGKFPFETVVLFSWSECSKRKLVFHFFKAILDYSFSLSRLICANDQRDSRTKFTSTKFGSIEVSG